MLHHFREWIVDVPFALLFVAVVAALIRLPKLVSMLRSGTPDGFHPRRYIAVCFGLTVGDVLCSAATLLLCCTALRAPTLMAMYRFLVREMQNPSANSRGTNDRKR